MQAVKQVSIVLSTAEVDVVLGALAELPYRISARVIEGIHQQAMAQLADQAQATASVAAQTPDQPAQ